MREILFRGKRCDNDEWVQGYYIRADHHWHKHGIHKDWIVCGASANGGWFALHNKYAVKAETVGQFTGLTDKNGKKIFEGDRCRVSRPCVLAYGKITFQNGCFWFVDDGPGGMLRLCDVKMNGFEIEVIGNIHDNPELLEGRKKDG